MEWDDIGCEDQGDGNAPMRCNFSSQKGSPTSVNRHFCFLSFTRFPRFFTVFSVSGNLKPGNWETYLPNSNLRIGSPKYQRNYKIHCQIHSTVLR